MINPYGRPVAPADRVTICLPIGDVGSLIGLAPIGEIISHPDPPNPGGHPGIDFGTRNATPVIACMDGTVDGIGKGNDGDWDVYIVHGIYYAGYGHLESYNTSLVKGMPVPKGSLIGHPQGKGEANYCFHWEFGYANVHARLNPMTYFDQRSREILEAEWANDTDQYKDRFPDIVNGYFKDKNY